jgi:hypothetical protein
VSANHDAATSVYIAGRLEALAGRFSEAPPPPPGPNRQAAWNLRPLFRIVDTGLRRLEEAHG